MNRSIVFVAILLVLFPAVAFGHGGAWRGPGRRVPPQDVDLAIGVEVGQGPHLPVRTRSTYTARRLLRETVHLPEDRGARLAVPPKDVRPLVQREIAGHRPVALKALGEDAGDVVTRKKNHPRHNEVAVSIHGDGRRTLDILVRP